MAEQNHEQPIEKSPSPLDNVSKGVEKDDTSDRSVGWIESLAQRSAGLPPARPATPAKSQSDSTLWRYAGLGFQFAATTALMAAVGYGLDRRFQWTPWGLVSFSAAGMIGGFYLLIKEALRNAAQDEKEAPKHRSRP